MAQEGIILTEDQVRALEKAKLEKEAHGEIETEHPGYLGSQDTYYVGNLKGVGRIYQQVRGRPRFRVRRVYGLGFRSAPETRDERPETSLRS